MIDLRAPTAGASAPLDLEIDIRGLLMLLWRRKMILFGAVLAGLLLALAVLAFVTPRYSASALLLVNQGRTQFDATELEQLFGRSTPSGSNVLSELEVIRSRALARKIVSAHNLMTDPELNPNFSAFGGGGKEKSANTPSGFKNLSLGQSDLRQVPTDLIGEDLELVISRFLDHMRVRSVPGSNAVRVEYMSVNPRRAAFMVNAIVDAYIEQRLENKYRAAQKVSDWLDKRLVSLRDDVREAEANAQNFKIENNLLEGTQSIISTQQLSDINQDLTAAKTSHALALAKLRQAKGAEDDLLKIQTLPDVLNSEIIQRLKLSVGAQENGLAELSARYGPRHPTRIRAESELASARTQLRTEIDKVLDNIRNDVVLTEQRIEAMENDITEASGETFADNTLMIQLRELEREAQSSRAAYESFLQTYKKSQEKEQLHEPEARVLSYGIIPYKTAYPNRLLILTLSMAVSLFVGLVVVLLLEKLDNTFRNAAQLETLFPFSCYAMIPALSKVEAQKDNGLYVIDHPSSIVAESVRSLRTALSLRGDKSEGADGKIVTITSSFPGEGKTTLSVWLARLAAKSGEKVVLIDGDLRRPNVHRSVGMKNDISLVDYLTDQKELDEVIQKDKVTGLNVILGSSVPNSALDLIGSDKMKTLVASLRKVYDLVIIDTPACLAVSDASVLATYSDTMLYAISWDETPREVVASGVRPFIEMGYKDVAFVMTNVDVKRHVQYAYGDTAYYYGRYQAYYS